MYCFPSFFSAVFARSQVVQSYWRICAFLLRLLSIQLRRQKRMKEEFTDVQSLVCWFHMRIGINYPLMLLPEYCQFSAIINKMIHNHQNLLILQLKIFKDFRPRWCITLNFSPGLKDLKTFKLNIKEVLKVLTVFPCNFSLSFKYDLITS